MPETLSCAVCHNDIGRDDFPAHQRDCRGAKPRLHVAGLLVRLEGDRIRVSTLGAGPFGVVWLAAQILVDADFAANDEAGVVRYLLAQLGDQA